MTLTTKMKRTATARTSAPHRTRPTRRSVHPSSRPQGERRERAAARPSAQNAALITIDSALVTEFRDWAVLAGASLAAWLTAAIAIGAV